jgi:hypothetical protein
MPQNNGGRRKHNSETIVIGTESVNVDIRIDGVVLVFLSVHYLSPGYFICFVIVFSPFE